MSDWRGERRGYRVNLFKGNETGMIGKVFNDTKYVGKTVGGSDVLDLDESTIDIDQRYTVTMEAETVADCGQANVGPSSDFCQLLIPAPISLGSEGKARVSLFLFRFYLCPFRE